MTRLDEVVVSGFVGILSQCNEARSLRMLLLGVV
jgi:hypothetical protein